MSPKLEIFFKINALNYVKYLLKRIPGNSAYIQSISGPRDTFSIARLRTVLKVPSFLKDRNINDK